MAKHEAQFDSMKWLGQALLRAIAHTPSLAEHFVRHTQEFTTPGIALELLNALKDNDVILGDIVPKREVTPERKEQLVAQLSKARAAKRKKAADESPYADDLI